MDEPIDARMEAKLRAALAIEHLEIVDTSGNCGGAFALVIVSPDFAKKMTLARHKMVKVPTPRCFPPTDFVSRSPPVPVNQILAEEITELHAFSQKTFTPEQWAKEQAK
ncbi:uncharacterized protein EHS24_000454 [Apiotrichum porosum]|uniref:BolA-like protein 3 n=1 Tax=Apiotrichum porosum TaxID=105984 RepID=A0A427YA05_9TREE|nr:uncharacterized protein EHS24_000454 [Apiotrichum porosum]RSH87932.1 hypothetical protein EHS24_000454 [Apiotrichum porosum]